MGNTIKIIIVLLLLVITLGAAGCGNTDGSTGAPRVGFAAPAFLLETPDGQAVSLDDLKGHPVMLNFWATWCEPCRDEIPFLQEISTDPVRLAGGLEVVAVDVMEGAKDVLDFQDDNRMTYRVLLDSNGKVSDLYNLKAVPTTYFIDKDGIIRYVKVGTFTTKKEIELILDKTIMKE